MDIVIGLSISTNWKRDSYNFVLVIVNWLIKMIYYKPVKITINTPYLAKVIINMVIQHHGLQDLIVFNRAFLYTSKFWSLLCYFFSIKRRLSITFHPQTNSQTKWLNNTMKAYLRVFNNFK